MPEDDYIKVSMRKEQQERLLVLINEGMAKRGYRGVRAHFKNDGAFRVALPVPGINDNNKNTIQGFLLTELKEVVDWAMDQLNKETVQKLADEEIAKQQGN